MSPQQPEGRRQPKGHRQPKALFDITTAIRLLVRNTDANTDTVARDVVEGILAEIERLREAENAAQALADRVLAGEMEETAVMALVHKIKEGTRG